MHDTAAAYFTPFQIAAFLVCASAVLGWFNHQFLRLPHVIGLTVMGALGAAALIVTEYAVPGIELLDQATRLIERLNFTETLLQGMLSFLLFAGALHVDLDRLRADWWPVLLLSTVGVIVSTLVVGALTWGVGLLLGLPIAPMWYFVFGALISPTDPVSVLGVLKEEAVPPSLQAAVAGESLFNDGVGIVVFTILLGAATTGTDFNLAEAGHLFLVEAGGGILAGLAIGTLGFLAMRSMDEYALEVLITLAVVMGGYALCQSLHVSGPLAMAVAGLLIGNYGTAYAMSDITRDYVIKFWELIDELLNSVLFLLIGLEMIALVPGLPHTELAFAAVAICLIGRACAVVLSTRMVPRARLAEPGSIPVLIWGGLRGGISIALALVLPAGATRDLLLAATFGAVLFAVLVQRSTLGRVIERYRAAPDQAQAAAPATTVH